MNTQRKLILVSGFPGTGKTTIGDWLEKNRDYVHINMEEGHRTTQILNDFNGFSEQYLKGNNNLVMTWGFSPDWETVRIVKKLQDFGFKTFWFTGDLATSREVILDRRDFDEETLQTQVSELKKWNIPEKIDVTIVDVFGNTGKFQSIDDLAKRLGV